MWNRTNKFVPRDIGSFQDFLPRGVPAWSDLFLSDFDLIREALKRPYARMDGDYQNSFAVPVPNFKAFRLVAQTVAQEHNAICS